MAHTLRFTAPHYEETTVKQTILIVGLFLGLANSASAQIIDIHSRSGDNGANFFLDDSAAVFHYEATVSGCDVAHVTTLEVFHNGNLKLVVSMTVLVPPTSYVFSTPVDMTTWGLKPGDSVTFKLTVVKIGLFGPLLASHTLFGNVVSEAPQAIEAPDPKP